MADPLSADALVRALKAEGVRVVEYKSWRTHNRNHKGPWGPVHGVMIHHTVTTGTDATVELCYAGRSDLPGPLCHGVIAKDGTVHLVGHGRANHAGSGDGDVLAAVTAETSLPADNEADTDGNTHFYGFEAINLGDGKDPWPAEQVEAIVRASAALCRAHGWGKSGDTSVIGHAEWQPGKIDPRGPGITMNDVRRRVAERLDHAASWTPTTPHSEEDTDMPLSDADVDRIAAATARKVALYKDTRLDSRDARQMWDDAASPHHTWQFRRTADGPDAWGLLSATAAEVGALRQVVAQLAAGGGLTAEQIEAAAATGARTALAELGARLTVEEG
ncbi:peptidoglycan recognition protein family protein [Streptomyces sp. URMC 129]|uniref:peptidoglycan recognition protein family protein n=1 Tax=Streptomyces sp. URMC 129 TaxID=3423407 RepID=UPI003F1AF31E